ncbi:MAG: nuclear transport factor 2 family protein [Candidatus Bathyarchaeota archaeon]|nr:nuclear transport factor 2 family protein [Candidatus Bathyarchaeota archaeon]
MEFAKDWIDAWNAHDLNLILSHYSDDFEMASPRIAQVMNEPTGKLKGKNNVRKYWEKSLTQSPDLRFELLEVLIGADSLVIYYHNVTRDKKAAEVFIFNQDGQVAKSMAHYN